MVCQILSNFPTTPRSAVDTLANASTNDFTFLKKNSLLFMSRSDESESSLSELSSCNNFIFSERSFSESTSFMGEYPCKSIEFDDSEQSDVQTLPKLADIGSLNVDTPVEATNCGGVLEEPVYTPRKHKLVNKSNSEIQLELSMDYINELRIHFSSEQRPQDVESHFARLGSSRNRGSTYSPGDDYDLVRSTIPQPTTPRAVLKESTFIMMNEYNVIQEERHSHQNDDLPPLEDCPSLLRQNAECDLLKKRDNANKMLLKTTGRRLSRSYSCPSNTSLCDFDYFDDIENELNEESDLETSSLSSFSQEFDMEVYE